MKNYLIKLHQYIFKNYYKNVSKEFREFTLLKSISLRLEYSQNEILKIKKENEKINNFYLKKISESDERYKKLVLRFEQMESNISNANIQINRLKNLKIK